VVALGLDQRLFLPRWINELGFLGSSPSGAKESAYIVPPNEYGLSFKNDINRMVFLNPLGRWSIICKVEADEPSDQGGRPRGEGGRPTPGSARSPARSRGFWTLLDVG